LISYPISTAGDTITFSKQLFSCCQLQQSEHLKMFVQVTFNF
jgi:hypothetical protein